MSSGSGWNLEVIRRWIVGVVVRKYPHITYPYSSSIFCFWQHPYILLTV